MKTALFILFLGTMLQAQQLTGPQIISKVNELMNPQSSKATMTMTITTTSGQQRTFEYLSYSKNYGEKTLMIYEKPSRVRGQKMLMLNHADDIWAYFARTRRVRKLATHAKKQKFEGSDFSYEDLGASDAFINDYSAKLVGEENKQDYDCYRLELTRKPDADVAYPKLVMWVIKENFVPVVIDYYEDNKDRVQKTLRQSDIQVIDGIPTGMNLEMVNHSDQSKTTMQFESVEYNIPLENELFTERGLKE